MNLDKQSQLVLDACDKCLDKLDMRKDVRQIFIEAPKKKQVMMFSATMTSETQGLGKKFISDPHEISVNEESKLTLHGLLQHYSKLKLKRSYGCSGIQLGCGLREVCAESNCSRQVVGRVQLPFHHLSFRPQPGEPHYRVPTVRGLSEMRHCYTFTAGVHSVDTISKSGSFLTLATSFCRVWSRV